MYSIYLNKIWEDLSMLARERFGSVNILNDSEVKALASQLRTEGLARCPLVGCSYGKCDYVTEAGITKYKTVDSEDQIHMREINYRDGLLARFDFGFTILATLPQQVGELEELIMAIYSSSRELTVDHPAVAGEKIPFEVMIDPTQEIKRSQGKMAPNQETVYQSIIYLKCDRCVAFHKHYHPAELAFDKTIVENLVHRAAAVENIKEWATQQDQRAALEAVWGELNSLLNATGGITTYSALYEVMRKRDCDVETALQHIQKECKERDEKQRRTEQNAKRALYRLIPHGKEDAALARYVEAVAQDMRQRLLPDSAPIVICANSEVDEWIQSYKEKRAAFPAVLISANCNYSLLEREYQTVGQNGTALSHSFSRTAFPLNYGIRVDIIAEDFIDAQKAERVLRETYSGEGVPVAIPDLRYDGERQEFAVAFREPSTVTQFAGWVENSIDMRLYSVKTPNVYYLREFGKDEVEDEPRMQLRALQQAQFALLCFTEIKFNARTQLARDYEDVTKGKPTRFQGLTKSENFIKLRESFYYARPIDRGLFDAVFDKVAKIYPLYEKMAAGMTYEQIEAELLGHAEYFAQRWLDLCNLLSLPEAWDLDTRGTGHSNNVRSTEGLTYCINYMVERADRTLAAAVRSYRDFLEEEIKEHKRQRELERQQREAEREASDGGEGGLLQGVLRTAAGVAIGNKVSGAGGRKERKDGRKDLMGSASCVYGKKRHSGIGGSEVTLRCSDCPVKKYCTRW